MNKSSNKSELIGKGFRKQSRMKEKDIGIIYRYVKESTLTYNSRRRKKEKEEAMFEEKSAENVPYKPLKPMELKKANQSQEVEIKPNYYFNSS